MTSIHRPEVSIARGKDPYQRTSRCLEGLSVPSLRGLSSAFVKFNLAPYFFEQRRTTDAGTHVEAVRAVVHYLRAQGIGDITVGEGPAQGDVLAGFRECGYVQMCEEEEVRLVDLDSDEVVEVSIPDARSLHQVGLPKSVLACDGLVDVAWMRTHSYARVSLCMKNLMGVVRPEKGIIHVPFPERITDLTSCVKPILSIVDGTTAFDEGRDRSIVAMDLTIAGTDIVAVDAVGTSVMGFDPLQIPYIRLAQERGLGIADLSRIVLVGLSIEEVRRPFAPI
ncbi:MAG: DUF362 domain-containing protein [Candidatus Latescibacterota bacterium]